jgi:Sec-independent protein translocase protein TatA
VHSRRLEDRIRELCVQAVSCGDDDLPEIMAQLRSALRQHVEGVRGLEVEQIQEREERRSRANE